MLVLQAAAGSLLGSRAIEIVMRFCRRSKADPDVMFWCRALAECMRHAPNARRQHASPSVKFYNIECPYDFHDFGICMRSGGQAIPFRPRMKNLPCLQVLCMKFQFECMPLWVKRGLDAVSDASNISQIRN